MSPSALLQLVEQIRALPGEATNLGLPRAGAAAAVPETLAPPELRRRVGAWLGVVGGHVAAVLPAQLARAAQAWDQADDFALVDDATRAEAARLRAAADMLAAGADEAARAWR